jgi:hypothetical protein
MDHIALRTSSATALAEFPRRGSLHGAVPRRFDDAASQFEMMSRAYSRLGGLVLGDGLAMKMREVRDQPISVLARWIVDRTVINFDWHGQMLLPLFQFDRFDMSPRKVVCDVLQTLASTHSDWGVALWFARPNGGLGGDAPIDVIDDDPAAVIQAAFGSALSKMALTTDRSIKRSIANGKDSR